MKPDAGETVWRAMDEVGGSELSAAGAARREEMLGELSRAVGVRRARRVVVRGVGALVLVCGVVAGVWGVVQGGGGSAVGGRGEIVRGEAGNGMAQNPEGPAPGAGAAPDAGSVVEERAVGRVVRVEMVADDPGIVARYAAVAGDRAARIDDEELMRLMDEMGRPTGIVRTAGKVMLTVEMESSPASEPMSEGPPDESVTRA